MSKDNLNLLEIVQKIARGDDGKNLDEAVKEAATSDEAVDEVTEEATEAKEAEEVTEEVTTEDGEIDYDKLASLVAEKLNPAKTEEQLDKVASLITKLNEETEKLAESQEMIVTGIFNATCIESGEANTSDIIKMAEEENSVVPQIVDMIYKYAEQADSLLADEYGEDYDENDVIKLASAIIESVENPFGIQEAVEEEVQKEAEEVDEMDALAEKVVEKILSKANKE